MAETTYVGIAATGDSRQHNGNVTNSTHGIAHPIRTALIKTLDYRYQYSLRMRRSDETMRDDQRNHLLLRAAAEGQFPRIQHLIRLSTSHDEDHTIAQGESTFHPEHIDGLDSSILEPKPHSTTSLALPAAVDTGPAMSILGSNSGSPFIYIEHISNRLRCSGSSR
jgi:hypothetical protein